MEEVVNPSSVGARRRGCLMLAFRAPMKARLPLKNMLFYIAVNTTVSCKSLQVSQVPTSLHKVLERSVLVSWLPLPMKLGWNTVGSSRGVDATSPKPDHKLPAVVRWRARTSLRYLVLKIVFRTVCFLSHPRTPHRSGHGCTVGVLPGPTRVLQSANSCVRRVASVVWSYSGVL